MIVVDASALVAIGSLEEDATAFGRALASAEAAVIAAPNYVEVGLTLLTRQDLRDRAELDAWLEALGVTVHHGADLGRQALEAYLRFGKGFHRARLNLADCFAYALAKQLDAPLLYKGDDFARTDIRSALQPT